MAREHKREHFKPSDATTNTRRFQSLLNNGGEIRFDSEKPQTFKINDTLVIGDNTSIYIGPNVTIKADAGMAAWMLVNSEHYSTAVDISSIAASGSEVTVTTSSAHGLAVGDPALVSWCDTVGFNGVFRVHTVADSTHFTYLAYSTPQAASASASTNATMTVRKANKNIKVVVDGVWDYDYSNQGTPSAPQTCAILMHGVYRLHMDGRYINAKKFNFWVCGAAFVTSNWLDFDGPSDGLHLLGPVHACELGTIVGHNDDNLFAVLTGDTSDYHLCQGEITVHARHVMTKGGVISPVRCVGSSLYPIDCTIDGVTGSPDANAAIVQAIVGASLLPDANTWIKQFKIKDIGADTGTAAQVSITAPTVDYVEIDGCSNECLTEAASSISFGGSTAVKLAVLRKMRSLNSAASGVNVKTIVVGASASVESLVIEQGLCEGDSTSNGRFLEVQGNVDDVYLNDCDIRTCHSFVNIASTAGGGDQRYHVNGGRVAANYGINNGASVDVTVFSQGVQWEPGNSAFRNASTGGTMRVHAGTDVHANTAKGFLRTSSQNCEAFGWSIPVDVAILTATDDQYCYNTNSGSGAGIGITRQRASSWALV